METELARIEKLLNNSWNGTMWHGDNVSNILAGIKWQKAFVKPGAGSHTIYELVQHMICWRKFVLENLKGNISYKVGLNSELDWPTKYEKNEANWKQTLTELEKNQAELLKALKKLDDKKLDELVPGKKFTWYIFLHGIIHHD